MVAAGLTALLIARFPRRRRHGQDLADVALSLATPTLAMSDVAKRTLPDSGPDLLADDFCGD